MEPCFSDTSGYLLHLLSPIAFFNVTMQVSYGLWNLELIFRYKKNLNRVTVASFQIKMLEAIQTINYLNEELEKKKNLEKLPTFCRLCIKPGIQERVTECGKRGE